MMDLNESLKQVRNLYEDGYIHIDTAIETSLLLMEKVDFDDADLPQSEKINHDDDDSYCQPLRTEEWRYISLSDISAELEGTVSLAEIAHYLLEEPGIRNLAMFGFGEGGLSFYRNEELWDKIGQIS